MNKEELKEKTLEAITSYLNAALALGNSAGASVEGKAYVPESLVNLIDKIIEYDPNEVKKPTLPQKVIDEIKAYKAERTTLTPRTFDGFIQKAIASDQPFYASNDYWHDCEHENATKDLLNAWNNNYKIEDDFQIISGAELMRTAIDDWEAFPDNDETIFDWYPELAKVLPDKKYKVWPMLEFEEAGE